MEKFEYAILRRPTPVIVEVLNEYGNAGFELVSVIYSASSFDYIYHFKRQIL